MKNQGKETHFSDSIIERNTCVKFLDFLINRRLKFNFHNADVVKRLSKHYSVLSRLGYYAKKPVLLQYYISYNKPVFGFGLFIFDCTSKNRLKPFFNLQKKILRQTCSKARFDPFAEPFNEINVLHVCDYYTLGLLNSYLKSVRTVLAAKNPNSSHDRKVTNVQTRKAQLNFFLFGK